MLRAREAATVGTRLVGLLLAGMALPGVGSAIGSVVQYFQGWGGDVVPAIVNLPDNFVMIVRDLAPFKGLAGIVQLGLGLYLLFRGQWIIRRLIRGLEGACPRCGYDVAGSRGGRCPECGVPVPGDAVPEAEATKSRPRTPA